MLDKWVKIGGTMTRYVILGTQWLTAMDGTIGFIAIATHGGWKCYTGWIPAGHDTTPEADAQKIAAKGAKTSEAIARGAFPSLFQMKYVD